MIRLLILSLCLAFAGCASNKTTPVEVETDGSFSFSQEVK